MKTTSCAGIFLGARKQPKLLNSLMISGIHPNQITTYPNFQNNPNLFAVCVKVKDKFDRSKAMNIYEFYNAIKQYELDDTLTENELSKTVSAHALSEVAQTYQPKKHSYFREGISAEVKFGA